MEGDHRVWPPQPGARHRRTPPEDTEPEWGGAPARRSPRDEEPRPRKRHPLDLDAGESEDLGEPWNPRIRRATERDPGYDSGPDWPSGGSSEPPTGSSWGRGLERDDWGRGAEGGGPLSAPPWDTLPPSARLYGTPVDPGTRRRAGTRVWRRWAGALAALLAGAGLVTGATAVVLRITEPPAETSTLSDTLAGVTATLPQGWSVGAVPPVTGFTSVVRDGNGGLVMARPVPGRLENAEEATAQAAELYSRLLLKGDRVNIVEDKEIPGGHTRALRAEYQDVVNRPAFMRVMLVTRGDKAVLLVGLLQPEETARRQALDAVMNSLGQAA
ncbi:hypothetical protein OHA25_55760 [Nonomuraea sp. NBC_00507]|uniref:hypothetical protein n=1 Tax=Nonomuraea sp. NBC_00507 TaxID=2976002 RepID=UPI002E182810